MMTTRKVVLNVGHLTGSTPPAEAVVEGTVTFEASTELGIDGKLIPIKAFVKPLGETIDLYILGPGQVYNVTVMTSGGYGSARFAIAPEAGPEIALCDLDQVDPKSAAKVPADPDWVRRLDREKQDRWDADQGLQEAIDAKAGLEALEQEVTDRQQADATLTTAVGERLTQSQGDQRYATAAQGSKADTAVQPSGLTKSAVGLGNVDNTSDANKPVSAAQAAADEAVRKKSIANALIFGGL